MKKKMNVIIAGRPYTLVTEEEETYVEDLARQVDTMVTGVMDAVHVSALDAAVLTAVNATDSARKEQAATESLRAQMKDLVEEMTRLKQELAECKREMTRQKKNGKR